MKPCIFVNRRIFPELIDRLREDFDVEENQADDIYTPQQMASHLADKDGALVTSSDRIDAGMLANANRLRALCSISVGTNHIDLDACTKRGILVTNTPDVLTETTADMGWALMMAAARRVTESERWLREGHWQRWVFDQFLGVDLHHSTLGIVGMGRIGQAIARRASGFAMNVVYHNRSRLPAETEAELRLEPAVRYLDLPTLLREADHVMIVVPYAAENHHMIGAEEIALMKPTATITNISRGGLIDEAALIAALREGRIAGVGLDVYEGEPNLNPGWLELGNVALAPHIGSASRNTRNAMAALAIDNLKAALSGRRPSCLVNPEAYKS